MIVTYRYRVKDKFAPSLNKKARAVNIVWNYCQEVQLQALKWNKVWPSGYDLCKLTSGTSKGLGISANTINQVCKEYAGKRKQHRKTKLRWRGKRSLGWIPMRADDLSNKSGFSYYGKRYDVWMSRPIPIDARICDGSSFSQDSLGRWYLNVVIELPEKECTNTEAIGVDLGLKYFAALSTGESIGNPREFRKLEKKLAGAQRAKKKKLARSVHQKITNRRKDFLHNESTRLVRNYGYIVVGDVSSSRLAKTNMAKSVMDASWSSFRFMLRYKAIAHGVCYEEVSERFTTQICSSCQSVSGPKGIADLGIRHWVCRECGSVHDRDANAAKNILARSAYRAPVEGAVG